MNSMQVTYELTAEDYLQALLTYRNRNFFSKWAFPFLLAFSILMLVLEIFLLITRPDESWLKQGIPLTIVYASILGYLYWGTPSMNAKRQFRNTPSAKGIITLNVSDIGLHYISSVTDATVAWNSYVKWMEGKMVFLLFPAPKIFIVIPKRAFSSEQYTSFSEILRQKIKG